jgi:hypothetical protein
MPLLLRSRGIILSRGAQLPPEEMNSSGPPLRFWGPDPKTFP